MDAKVELEKIKSKHSAERVQRVIGKDFFFATSVLI